MIDIHSHIIPGVDDGAQNIEEAIEMLKAAYEEGIRSMIATPHYDSRKQDTHNNYQEKLVLVQKEAKKIDQDFNIYLGNEIFYEEGVLEAVQSKKAFTMAGGRYVLIEFSPSQDYKKMYYGMREFISEGYIPIIAHVERYDCLWKKEEKIKELIDLGCYIQMNAESLMGSFMNARAAYCRKLAECGFIHFIASDCHNLKDRKPLMKSSLLKIKKNMTHKCFQGLEFENAEKVIENKYI